MTTENIDDFSPAFDEMARQLGGRTALQSLLQVGPSALSNYRNRGHIPADKMSLLDGAATARGLRLNPQTLHLTPFAAPVILLIITGGIAAYKSLTLIRRLKECGAVVRGVMTKSAQHFITPLSVSTLTTEKTYTDLFDLTDEQEMGHIQLARGADLVLIAPATANFIAKLAHGMADDLASTLCLASTAPLVLAPAMNPAMWGHPATQANLALITARGAHLIGPDAGDTACAETGMGRLVDETEIARRVMALLDKSDAPLAGVHIVITSGPTFEPIDPVRYIGNRSSGQQGHAIAAACIARGAEVTLVSGPVALSPPSGARTIHVETAAQMQDAVATSLPADVFIGCAAVADWRLSAPSSAKLKKTAEGPPHLALVETPDILSFVGHHKARPQLVIGFAAETDDSPDDLVGRAQDKRRRKASDWILANPVNQESGTVFGSSQNEITCITEDSVTRWGVLSKDGVASRLADMIAQHMLVETKGNTP